MVRIAICVPVVANARNVRCQHSCRTLFVFPLVRRASSRRVWFVPNVIPLVSHVMVRILTIVHHARQDSTCRTSSVSHNARPNSSRRIVRPVVHALQDANNATIRVLANCAS